MANKCGHCKGTGVCRRGREDDNSCNSCRDGAGYRIWENYRGQILVKCSVCGGTGWV